MLAMGPSARQPAFFLSSLIYFWHIITPSIFSIYKLFLHAYNYYQSYPGLRQTVKRYGAPCPSTDSKDSPELDRPSCFRS